jgi:hypothetical protein
MEVLGDPGSQDGRSGLTIEVRNRTPRMISEPVVELDIPAGAEVDERARQEIGRNLAQPPDFSGRRLTLRLRSLWPGATHTIELPLRWTVPGRLRGMGAIGYAADRPQVISVLPSREVEVSPASGSNPVQGGRP